MARKKADQDRLFEGYEVENTVTKFKGTVEIEDFDRLNPYEKVRFTGWGQVVEIRHKDDDGSLKRVQIIRPLSVEITDRKAPDPDAPLE